MFSIKQDAFLFSLLWITFVVSLSLGVCSKAIATAESDPINHLNLIVEHA